MSINTGLAQTALDNRGLASLRHAANQDQNNPETLSQVAGQFEALFLNMMLKSMRQASLGTGILDSSQSQVYQDMADQQLSINIAASGGLGLKEVIMRQLGSRFAEKIEGDHTPRSLSIDTVTMRPTLPERASAVTQATIKPVKALEESEQVQEPILSFDSPESFVRQLWSMAEKAAEKIGVNPEVILSQAALETGWGRHMIHRNDAQPSFNLFNIKADNRWQGDFATVGTLEYRNGVAVKEQAKFRVYDSYQASFDDYIRFLQTQPRYQKALEQTADPEAFIEGLHDAGYATDPNYADKIKRIMNSDTLAFMSIQRGQG